METITPATTSLSVKYQYQESAEKSKSYSIRNHKRKRLFEDHSEHSSEDETGHIDKKVKVVVPPITAKTILKTFQMKDYPKCLEMIGKAKKETLGPNDSQFKIIQAACWTMMDENSDKAFEALNAIIENEPKNSFAFYGLGLHQFRQGELAACIRSFGSAIDLNPSGAMKRAMEFKAKAKSLLELVNDGKLKLYFAC